MRELIDNLRKETETTLRVFYALRQFRQMLAREDYVSKINENANFWRIFEISLRTNMFLGIRRLYEAKAGTFNFQRFIDVCIANLADFSGDALRQRKCEASPTAAEWIDSYMEDVYEPTADDFKALSKLVRQSSKNMKGVYSEAATKLYAHQSISTILQWQQYPRSSTSRKLSKPWRQYGMRTSKHGRCTRTEDDPS